MPEGDPGRVEELDGLAWGQHPSSSNPPPPPDRQVGWGC